MALKIRIGSRSSKLALAQAAIVRDRLAAQIPAEIEIVEIRTSGDKMTSASLADVGGKGLFIKELEQALADRMIDAAVHSMKDLPALLPERFRVAAVPARENTADILVTRDGSTLSTLPAGARLGTSSSRRRFQALRMNRGLEILPLRGNVDTRLARVADGSFDAIIVAMAGLRRLGRVKDVRFVELDARDFIPAGGQGALAIETLANRGANELDHALSAINDARAFYETAAERAFLAAMNASCTTPVGVQARIDGDTLALAAMLFSPDGARDLSESMREPIASDFAPTAAEDSGKRLAEKMLARGAAALLGK
ncbi:MAG TPA: hydroxymethylbilane synthase [Candidatus Binatus sp.]|uniref:hydroxymethylbilane synthase n=1 Tax=Candidatus Binatus sp. TaxID=2811406 RepID=UPI002B489D8F|nr:hydroxymethylbilane synthase [Candidatus Binatus sp.]HKN13469.1 hydroxymethylbilane synthase [Candidatus Binatus sp.]